MQTRTAQASPEGWLSQIAVVIPAWQPEACLLTLVSELELAGVQHMVLVDDGSGYRSRSLFDELARRPGVAVCRHSENYGKGRALKTAFTHILQALPAMEGVVTADADGQHLPKDILRVARSLADQNDRPVLGVRQFSREVPLRSRMGNRLTRVLFTLLTGCRVRDTQTGLRGLPAALLPELLPLPGDRYEYEMVMLAHLCQTGQVPREVPVETVYLDGNRASHFNPLWDSLRIYRVLLRSAARRVRLPGKHVDAPEKPRFRTV